ncbi:MAG: sulfurtransferase TusA family protein [Emcibacter sp.]|nr:sulfurtransferase TusA family protein [Emcibacter sp.]
MMSVALEIYREILDVRGHKCPVPVLRVRRILESMSTDTILKVIATDPMTQIDFPFFCQQTGHKLIQMKEVDNIFYYFIKKIGKE